MNSPETLTIATPENINWLKDAIMPLTFTLIGGLLAFFGTWWQQFKSSKAAEQNAQEEVAAMVTCIHDEVRVLWAWYTGSAGADVDALKPGGFINKIYPLSGNYFPIFRAYAGKLGYLKDSALRTLIVQSYTRAIILVDMFEMNNHLVKEHTALVKEADRVQHEKNSNAAASMRDVCVNYALLIQRQHTDFKNDVIRLLELFPDQRLPQAAGPSA